MKRIKPLVRIISLSLVLCLLAACSDSGNSASSSKAGSAAASQGSATVGSSSQASSSVSSVDNSSTLTSSASSVSYGNVDIVSARKESYQKYGHEGNPDMDYPTLEGERDFWTWPFSRDSIWNMPLGSDAEYKPMGWKFANVYGVDEERLWMTDENDELLSIYRTGMDNRWPIPNNLVKDTQTIYWPRGVTVSKDDIGNTCTAILQPDFRTVKQMQPCCRDDATSTYITGFPANPVDIYSTGEAGTHWGSALSTLGGSIRLGELTGDEPIRHALKIDPWGKKWLNFDWNNMGYTWPATTADAYAAESYGGADPDVLMGSLVALPRDATIESLGIKSAIGKKLFFTLQNYGAYIVDDSAWDSFNWCADIQVIEEVKQVYNTNLSGRTSTAFTTGDRNYANDMKIIIENLCVIKNSAKDSVGGGGTPCQPLAPNLPSLK